MFRVGQKVVCVDDTSPRGYEAFMALEIKKGSIYTVREVGLVSWMDGSECIRVCETNRTGGTDEPFFARRFRPIVERNTDIGFAHEILRKVNNRATAKARA